MTTPQPVAADVPGNSAQHTTQPYTIKDIDPVIHHEFSRTFEHYVSNGMDAYGYTESLTGDFVNAWMIDEGWQYIPYCNPAVAMRGDDLIHICTEGVAVRIDELGFEVKDAQMMRQEMTPTSGVTTINNSYASQPKFEFLRDDLHFYDTLAKPRPASSTTYPPFSFVVSPDLMPNNKMRNQEVTSFDQGALKRVVWSQNWTGTGTDSYAPDLMLRQTFAGSNPWEMYSSFNHLGRRIVPQMDAQTELRHTWHNKDPNQWYPLRMPQQGTDWAGQNGVTNNLPATFPMSRDFVLNGTEQTSTNLAANTRGTNLPNFKHNQWQPVNLETGVPGADLNLPQDCYLKINRLFDQEGPINLFARIVVRYYVKLSVLPADHGFNFNTNTATFGTGGDTTWVGTTLTSGLLRRFRSWGVPDLSAAPFRNALGYKEIYQHATYDTGATHKQKRLKRARSREDTATDKTGDPLRLGPGTASTDTQPTSTE